MDNFRQHTLTLTYPACHPLDTDIHNLATMVPYLEARCLGSVLMVCLCTAVCLANQQTKILLLIQDLHHSNPTWDSLHHNMLANNNNLLSHNNLLDSHNNLPDSHNNLPDNRNNLLDNRSNLPDNRRNLLDNPQQEDNNL